MDCRAPPGSNSFARTRQARKSGGRSASEKSQIWQTEVGTFQTAKIRLEPSVAAENERAVGDLPAGCC